MNMMNSMGTPPQVVDGVKLTDKEVVNHYLNTTPAYRVTLRQAPYGGRMSRCGVANGGRRLAMIIMNSQYSGAPLPEQYRGKVDLEQIDPWELHQARTEILEQRGGQEQRLQDLQQVIAGRPEAQA